MNGAGTYSTGSFLFNIDLYNIGYGVGGNIGSASANLLKNSGKVVDFNV